MPDDLYDRDILAWSIAQAERLRRVAAGERVNDVDWANVIEEIESVGSSQVDAVNSLLLQALLHALKVVAWPDHAAARKWRNEIDLFLDQARVRFTPGMAQRLDLSEIHRRARKLVLKLDMRRPPRPLPETTDLTLAGLLDESLGADALIARLRPA
ncbi:DUF29 family protein [Paracraurococcus lichenis]|uniref:DUF29 family protein n=1 Tax=Paracraurococcus lichenis TaxID=3064888 RepID=A0ABT9DUH6_9PROT|nr:DUF29 family protein [Paracraurococcus sp. LOR1-02]MDO9707555.1 DUF29 family protein [Paracraurococcus sp. LOR1-02]